MSVDKLVDSAQLNSDLTSIANAIRTKGGTSASLAFPADFISAINAISGGGGATPTRYAELKDFVTTASKWYTSISIPNVFADGGCAHFKFPDNQSADNDAHLISFGNNNLASWSPTGTNYTCFLLNYKNTNTAHAALRFRASGIDGTIQLTQFMDVNGIYEFKLYVNKFVDVNTGTEYAFSEISSSSSAITSFMSSISSKTYLAIGANQTAPLAGHVLSYFAFEDS